VALIVHRRGGAGKLALGRVCVHPAEPGPNVLQPVAEGRSAAPDRPGTRTAGLAPPPTKELPHPFDLGELLGEDRVGRVIEPTTGHDVRGQGKDHDGRVGRVDLA